MRPPRWILWVFVNALCVGVVAASSRNSNPYKVFGLTSDASDDDIRRTYRKLCLKWHPDKQRHLSAEEQAKSEAKFKELQHAYSLIGTAEDREKYRLREASSSRFRPTQSNPKRYKPYGTYVYDEDIFSSAFQNQNHYQSRYQRSPFTSQSDEQFDLFKGRWNLSDMKSVYKQDVEVSLNDLYNGKADFVFYLKENVLTRSVAAFRGGIGYALLYQSLLSGLPFLRASRRWWVALLAACGIFFSNLPSTVESQAFRATIKEGYTEGTTFTFNPRSKKNIEVVFTILEKSHPTFRRVEHDLHTEVYLTRKQAQSGCKLTVDTLDEVESSIEIELAPNEITRQGQTRKVPGKGWPRRKVGGHGDLIIHFHIRSKLLDRRKR